MTRKLQHQKDLLAEINRDERIQDLAQLASLEQLTYAQEQQLTQLKQEELTYQRQQKQTYLREEVLEKGLAADDFMNYLSSKKEDGQNIDNWEFTELEEVVKEYISLNITDKGEEEEEEEWGDYENGNQPEMQTMQLDMTEITSNNLDQTCLGEEKEREKGQKGYKGQNKANACFTNKHQEVITDEQEIIYCKQLKGVPDIKAIKVRIYEPQKRSAGIFKLGATYTVYKVESQITIGSQTNTFTTMRRFSDFNWLRLVLKKFFPGRYIPSLFKKKSKRTTQFKQQKRLLYLQQFIEDISSNQDFLECPYMQAFLQKGDNNNKEFFKIQQKGKDSKEIKNIQNIVNGKGFVTGSINSDNKEFLDDMNSYCHQAENCYNGLKKLSKQLQVDLDNLSTTCYSMGEQYKELFDITNTINRRETNATIDKLKGTYLRLNNMCVNWGNLVVEQQMNVTDNLYNQLKYSCREFDSYKEILKKRNEEGDQYAKYKLKLLAKKDKLYNASFNKSHKQILSQDEQVQKSQAFDAMLPQENNILRNLRNQFSYYNNYCFVDLQRQLERKQQSYSKTYNKVAESIQNLNNNLGKGMNEFISFLNEGTVDNQDLEEIKFIQELQQSIRKKDDLSANKLQQEQYLNQTEIDL